MKNSAAQKAYTSNGNANPSMSGNGNPSKQDTDSNNVTNLPITKAKANAEMTSDGGYKGNDQWKGNVSC